MASPEWNNLTPGQRAAIISTLQANTRTLAGGKELQGTVTISLDNAEVEIPLS